MFEHKSDEIRYQYTMDTVNFIPQDKKRVKKIEHVTTAEMIIEAWKETMQTEAGLCYYMNKTEHKE